MMDSEHFPVLKNAPFIWIGRSELRAPYRMVRLSSVHSHLIVSLSGRGRTLIDGKSVEWTPGKVMLGPVGVHHAFEVDGPGPWNIAWVFFDDRVDAPALPGKKAQLIEADTEDFVSVLYMLIREAAGAAQPVVMEALVALLNIHARRIAGSTSVDSRILRMWMKVEADLVNDWSMPTLARLACMSEEHLRRLCHRYYQHSPMNHLAHLRMQRAATMLRSSPAKVDDIARTVGYASMYSFSVAFRRWSGLPPSLYRAN